MSLTVVSYVISNCSQVLIENSFPKILLGLLRNDLSTCEGEIAYVCILYLALAGSTLGHCCINKNFAHIEDIDDILELCSHLGFTFVLGGSYSHY